MAATAPTRAGAPAPLRWDGRRLHVVDQTLLPGRERVLELDGASAVAEALHRLAVRGAPLIGVAAAYGLAMAVAREPEPAALARAAAELRAARPTAANLGWALDRVTAAALAAHGGGREGTPSTTGEAVPTLASAALAEAEAIEAENVAAGEAVARLGADLLAELGVRRVLTHCNTGVLACGSRGSALGAVEVLAGRMEGVHVLVCETRPLLQGARLTAWELSRLGLAHEVVVDAAAAGLVRAGEVDAVVVGFDRMAANGDAANKVGTYAHALAAHAAGIPFVFVGPTSSIDASIPAGDGIEIEERPADEVRRAGGALLTLPDTPVRNPAFDVTPADLVTAVVTERGVARPVDAGTVAALLR
jgi:methylthioribose-1-phosphate isomerase